jgi:hypothetical protein
MDWGNVPAAVGARDRKFSEDFRPSFATLIHFKHPPIFLQPAICMPGVQIVSMAGRLSAIRTSILPSGQPLRCSARPAARHLTSTHLLLPPAYRRPGPLTLPRCLPPRATADDADGNALPTMPVAMIDQAAAAVSAAIAQGQTRLQIDLLLPVNEKERRFTATEPDDYPCSLQREFDVVATLTIGLLQRVLGDTNAVIGSKRLDDGGVEGEPCAVLYLKSDPKKIAAVVYPTADRLNQIKDLAKESQRPLLLVNPQWREEGQVISDFGIGPWKKAAMDFLGTFLPAYFLKEKRIGSPGTIDTATGTRFATGGVIRVLRRWPGVYEAYAMSADGSSQLLSSTESEPRYNELDAMITEGRKRKLEIFELAKKASYMYITEEEAVGSGYENEDENGGREAPRPAGAAMMSDADIEALDAASVRRLLAAYGQPTSGKISKLKERLKEVQAEAAGVA